MTNWIKSKQVHQRAVSAAPLTAIKVPRKYVILLVNDDFTPMDFVVLVLKQFFYFDDPKATEIMLRVHILGQSICGIFTKDVAETKVAQVNDFARQLGYPLLCSMQPE